MTPNEKVLLEAVIADVKTYPKDFTPYSSHTRPTFKAMWTAAKAVIAERPPMERWGVQFTDSGNIYFYSDETKAKEAMAGTPNLVRLIHFREVTT